MRRRGTSNPTRGSLWTRPTASSPGIRRTSGSTAAPRCSGSAPPTTASSARTSATSRTSRAATSTAAGSRSGAAACARPRTAGGWRPCARSPPSLRRAGGIRGRPPRRRRRPPASRQAGARGSDRATRGRPQAPARPAAPTKGRSAPPAWRRSRGARGCARPSSACGRPCSQSCLKKYNRKINVGFMVSVLFGLFAIMFCHLFVFVLLLFVWTICWGGGRPCVRARFRGSRAARSGSVGATSRGPGRIWGFDYSFTNYNFKIELNFKKKH